MVAIQPLAAYCTSNGLSD